MRCVWERKSLLEGAPAWGYGLDRSRLWPWARGRTVGSYCRQPQAGDGPSESEAACGAPEQSCEYRVEATRGTGLAVDRGVGLSFEDLAQFHVAPPGPAGLFCGRRGRAMQEACRFATPGAAGLASGSTCQTSYPERRFGCASRRTWRKLARRPNSAQSCLRRAVFAPLAWELQTVDSVTRRHETCVQHLPWR